MFCNTGYNVTIYKDETLKGIPSYVQASILLPGMDVEKGDKPKLMDLEVTGEVRNGHGVACYKFRVWGCPPLEPPLPDVDRICSNGKDVP